VRALRKDGSQAEIVAALRKAGATVIIFDKTPDLFVRYLGLWFALECKPTKNAKWQKGQKELCEKLGIHVVTTPEQALRIVGAM
jgi:hypothetical protein